MRIGPLAHNILALVAVVVSGVVFLHIGYDAGKVEGARACEPEKIKIITKFEAWNRVVGRGKP